MPTCMTIHFIKYDFNEIRDKHYPYLPPKQRFDKEAQAPDPLDTGNPLLKSDMKYVQLVVGSLLFY